ncbi:MAG: hypothetical protein KGL39_17995 [Patescibacteria group bacterium]|nr:hypothetical protein [Patescibacteria group bacterium]
MLDQLEILNQQLEDYAHNMRILGDNLNLALQSLVRIQNGVPTKDNYRMDAFDTLQAIKGLMGDVRMEMYEDDKS